MFCETLLLRCLQVAPVTTEHILKLAKLGGYNSNHFFRVDKGFVAQTASVAGGRLAALSQGQSVRRALLRTCVSMPITQ